MSALEEAVQEYIRRRLPETRLPGEFVRNQGGTGDRFVWYPESSELRKCCYSVPFSRRYFHLKSVEHVAMLYNVNPNELRSAIRSHRRKVNAEYEKAI